jgi:hypothetical protein
MPYILEFTRPVTVTDREHYINECCVGGDIIVEALLPAVRKRYEDIESAQEDWGWFIWCRKGPVMLAIDVFTDDAEAGRFRVCLTTRVKKLFGYKDADTPELEELRSFVEGALREIGATEIALEDRSG